MRHFKVNFQSIAVVKTLKIKAAECYKIFEFDSPSRQFIFNAIGIRLEGTVMHYKL